MRLSSRIIRRIIILIAFLAVFGLTGLGLRKATTPAPSCTDGIMNGQEEGIDCGLYACGNYCEPDLPPPEVSSIKLIKAQNDDYDFVAQVTNNQTKFGASEVSYKLTLVDNDGQELANREGVFYLLPNQTKYLILTHITTATNVGDVDFKIKSARWQRLESLEGLSLIVKNHEYEVANNGNSSTLNAVILNDSNFDFDTVDIDIILRNASGDIIGVNRSDIKTFKSKTERGFQAAWPFRLSSSVTRVDIYPSANLFENYNFIKAYGSGTEKFQEY